VGTMLPVCLTSLQLFRLCSLGGSQGVSSKILLRSKKLWDTEAYDAALIPQDHQVTMLERKLKDMAGAWSIDVSSLSTNIFTHRNHLKSHPKAFYLQSTRL